MPELPDITIYLEALEARILGQRLERVRVASPFLLRSVDPPLAEAEGRRVRALRRLGKRIVLGLDDELFLLLHLMIAGRLRWSAPGANPPGRIGLAAFDFADGTLLLTEASRRKRASLHLVRGSGALGRHDGGGLEPLDADLAAFRATLGRESHTLKRTLTDPHLFSGIGNAYSDEILHRARLSPFKLSTQLDETESARLFDAMRSTLTEWIERLRREAAGDFPRNVTAFRDGFAVHGRWRKPCPICGSPVQRIVYAENEANYCARCQTGGRLLADRALSRLLREDWPRTLEELEQRQRPSRPRDRFGRPLPPGSADELAGGPGVSVNSADALRRAVELFDGRRFFEAHELFESIWKSPETDAAGRGFWKALAQVAVGCCHCQRGNARGAVALLERAATGLAAYPTPHRGVETGRLAALARELAARVRERGASTDLDFPRFPVAR